MLGLTVLVFVAMLKPAFCQEPEIDKDLIIYSMAVSANQQVKFRLPLDIRSGDMITGSVVEESKNTSGKINKTSSTLEGTVIEIDGKQTKISNRLISFIVPAGIASLPFLLKISAGKVIEQGNIPISSIISPFGDDFPIGFSPEKVGQPGQPLTISGNFDGNASNTNVSLGGQNCDVIAESNRMSIVQVWENATAGVSNLTIQENNITEQHKINVATLDLSAENTNLRKGQKVTVNIVVNGLDGLTADKMNFKLRLENLSPQTISFLKEPGNVIVRDINTKAVKDGKYKFSTKIIAITTGAFTVSANLTAPEKSDCTIAYETEWASIIQQEKDGKKKCEETKGSGLDDCLLKLNTIIKDLRSKCQAAYLDCIKNR